ncbi:MAG: DUF4184 family protein [Nitrososphaerota archaeon]
MPLTPLHLSYVWPLKLRFKRLSFAALTLGAMVPDLENPILYLLGFYPWRLITHSFFGTFTVDLFTTILLLKILSRLRIERMGLNGFNDFKLNGYVLFSAFLGSLSHVLVDWTHHSHNPLFQPFNPIYVRGLLLNVLNNPFGDILVNSASLLILVLILKKILNDQGHSLLLMLHRPFTALSLITARLSRS